MLNTVLLLLGAFLAAAISGAAGFGGALLLLPMLTHAVGPTLAVPILTVAQIIGNLSRVALGFRQIHWRPVRLFLLSAVPMAALGAYSFTTIPKSVVVRLIGGAILIFVLLRLSGRLQLPPRRSTLLAGGAATGYISGLIGSAGPLGAAVFLSLGLPPVAYIASEASTALTIHAVKILIYQRRLELPLSQWSLACQLGLVVVLGTWFSKRFIESLDPERFRLLVSCLLALVALRMVIMG